jgi:hypothetical protein
MNNYLLFHDISPHVSFATKLSLKMDIMDRNTYENNYEINTYSQVILYITTTAL